MDCSANPHGLAQRDEFFGCPYQECFSMKISFYPGPECVR